MTIPCDSGGKAEETKDLGGGVREQWPCNEKVEREAPGAKLRPYTDLSMPDHADMTFQTRASGQRRPPCVPAEVTKTSPRPAMVRWQHDCWPVCVDKADALRRRRPVLRPPCPVESKAQGVLGGSRAMLSQGEWPWCSRQCGGSQVGAMS